MPDEQAPDALAPIRARCEAATPGPWKYYQPSEFPRDWRISRDAPAGSLGPGTRDYIGRLTSSHDRKISGNGGRALEAPLEADVALMTHARSDIPLLLSKLAAAEAEGAGLRAEHLPHMCRDGHAEIRWRGDGELCPVCRLAAALGAGEGTMPPSPEAAP